MDEIAKNRQAICEFLSAKKPSVAANTAQTAIKNDAANEGSSAPEGLQVLAAIGSASLEKAWQQHPAKQLYEQTLPLAKGAIRQYPWWSLGAASALGALAVLSPGLRRQAWQSLRGQLPSDLQRLL